jgi:hypothetical protein
LHLIAASLFLPLLGVTLNATLDLWVGFSVTRDVENAHQVLRITPTIINPQTVVTSKSVDIAWWVYLAFVVIAGLVGALIVVIVDGIVAEIIAGNQLQSAMKNMALDPTNSLADMPVTLSNPTLTLNQPGAPPMPTPMGDVLYRLLGIAAHDLRIGASFEQLPDPLIVTCQIPDSADPGARLDGLGGELPTGGRWRLMLDDAITLVEAGRTLLVRSPEGNQVQVVVSQTSAGVPYLCTQADDLGINNLSNLPRCPV